MRVLITGADGFIGRELLRQLVSLPKLRNKPLERIILVDRQFENVCRDSRVEYRPGDICDPGFFSSDLLENVEVVFHLASVPGGAAEEDYETGFKVNLQAGLSLVGALRNTRNPPVFVYASSIAVYGSGLSNLMTERDVEHPELSYAAHKLMMEIASGDLTRRGEIDGRSIRLPGVVARPVQAQGLRSAFMSDLLHACKRAEKYICPVSPAATCWWLSCKCAVANLIHAAELVAPTGSRVWQLPVQLFSIEQMLDALSVKFGPQSLSGIRFQPDPALQDLFGSFPTILTPDAETVGFAHDGSIEMLITNALDA